LRLHYLDVTDVVVLLEAGSFPSDVAIRAFELSFSAAVPQMCPHAVVTLKGILVTAVKYTLVESFLVVCEMSGCIKIFECRVAAGVFAVEQAAMEVVLICPLDSCTLEFGSTGGTRTISG
jgi:hypothetical protein